MKRPAIYSRPAKPLRVPVPERDWRTRATITAPAAPIAVHAGSECHVTPPDVAASMARAAGLYGQLDVLEPSAGTGNLIRAAIAAGCDPARIAAVEMHCALADALRKWHAVECADFLELAQEWRGVRSFDRVLMNPPFSRVRAHVNAAISLLRPNGFIVALVPITFDRDDTITVDGLPVDTFANAKVRTKIIRIEGSP